MSRLKRIPKMLLAMLALPGLMLCAGCETTQMIQPANCISLVPDSWKKEVPPPPLPENTIGGWTAYGIASNGQLEKANGRTEDTITIVSSCEAMVQKAYQKTTKKWWEVWK